MIAWELFIGGVGTYFRGWGPIIGGCGLLTICGSTMKVCSRGQIRERAIVGLLTFVVLSVSSTRFLINWLLAERCVNYVLAGKSQLPSRIGLTLC